MLEKVNDVYEKNIAKIFPIDTLRSWMKVQNKSAYEIMSKPENKLHGKDKDLYAFLNKIKKVTGLEARSGISGGYPESIKRYVERGLQNAASKDLLDNFK